jgi:hypothetical protein
MVVHAQTTGRCRLDLWTGASRLVRRDIRGLRVPAQPAAGAAWVDSDLLDLQAAVDPGRPSGRRQATIPAAAKQVLSA